MWDDKTIPLDDQSYAILDTKKKRAPVIIKKKLVIKIGDRVAN